MSAVRFRPKPPNNSTKSSTYRNVGAFFVGKFGKIAKITALARATLIVGYFLGLLNLKVCWYVSKIFYVFVGLVMLLMSVLALALVLMLVLVLVLALALMMVDID